MDAAEADRSGAPWRHGARRRVERGQHRDLGSTPDRVCDDSRGPSRGAEPFATLAAVNGAAVRWGMNMALGCDVRLAARRARFDTRFLQLGLHPGGGHTWMMRRVVGPQVAAAAVLFGEVLDGEEAARVGLAYRCVDDDRLAEVAHAMAAKAASAPRELVELRSAAARNGEHRRHGRRATARANRVWSTKQPCS